MAKPTGEEGNLTLYWFGVVLREDERAVIAKGALQPLVNLGSDVRLQSHLIRCENQLWVLGLSHG